jgi:hypothetical protein
MVWNLVKHRDNFTFYPLTRLNEFLHYSAFPQVALARITLC